MKTSLRFSENVLTFWGKRTCLFETLYWWAIAKRLKLI